MNFWDTFAVEERSGPKFTAICDALADAIRGGRLAPGRRLPSHRMLARKLGVSVGTVTRAYEEALERGLIQGEVGRGTYVSPHPPLPLAVVDTSRIPSDCLDLYQNFPVAVPEVENAAWVEALRQLRRAPEPAALLGSSSWSDLAMRYRRAGAAWIGRLGIAAPPERVFECPGLQAALSAIFAAVTHPGDLVAAAELTHPSLRILASRQGLEIAGLPVTERGLDLDALDALCRARPVRAVHCAPTIQSPTAATMPVEQRRHLADLAREHDLLIIEEEAPAFLLEEPLESIAAFAPERTILLAEVWMALSLGLRTSYLLVPDALRSAMAAAVASSTGTTAPLIAEVAAYWIDSGHATRLIEHRRAELVARNAISREILGHRALRSHPVGSHVWLELPPPWRSSLFVMHAEQAGVAVVGTEWFAIGHRDLPEGIRICVGHAPDRARLLWALERLDGLIDHCPPFNRPAT